jgi:hypothetical protein
MSVSAGGGVSVGGGGGVDLDAIISGGAAFTERLRLFDEAARRAADNARAAETLLAEARRTQAAAEATQARADALIAENTAKSEELDMALAAARQARADLDGRLAPLLQFLRT